MRTKLIREELEDLRNGCWNRNWQEIINGIGYLGYVILGTVAEFGVSVDVLLHPDMVGGTLTLDLRSIPKEVRHYKRCWVEHGLDTDLRQSKLTSKRGVYLGK